MRNAVALHGLRRKFAFLSVVMVVLEGNNGVHAHMVQGLWQPLLSGSRCRRGPRSANWNALPPRCGESFHLRVQHCDDPMMIFRFWG